MNRTPTTTNFAVYAAVVLNYLDETAGTDRTTRAAFATARVLLAG